MSIFDRPMDQVVHIYVVRETRRPTSWAIHSCFPFFNPMDTERTSRPSSGVPIHITLPEREFPPVFDKS